MSDWLWPLAMFGYAVTSVAATFLMSVIGRVNDKRPYKDGVYRGEPPPFILGFFWFIFLPIMAIIWTCEKFTDSAEHVAEKIVKGKETPESLLRPVSNPSPSTSSPE